MIKWFSALLVITILCGLTYTIGQQILRQSANDPQIQMSQDLAESLANNQPVDQIVPQSKIDISKSLSTFVIVYNDQGKEVSSSAILLGDSPVLPSGVLDYVKNNGEDRITWQPMPGVRVAAVVNGFHGNESGYVLVGRSLKEVEKREDDLLKLSALGWLASFVVVSIPFLFSIKKHKRK